MIMRNVKIKNPFMGMAQMAIGLPAIILLNSCYKTNSSTQLEEITEPLPSVVEEQKVVAGPLVLEAKGGHQVYIDDPTDTWASVKENLLEPFKRDLLRLPIYKAVDTDVEELAKKDPSMQHYKVHVCFPEQDSAGIGYVYIGDMGLKGGVRTISIDVQSTIDAIVEAYRRLGRQPETINYWSPFVNGLAVALGSVGINLELDIPEDPSVLDPGNIRNQLTIMGGFATGRNFVLANYGQAWYNMIIQIRDQINQQKRLNIDAAHYPSNSYIVKLVPNVDKIIPLIGEVDHLLNSLYLRTNNDLVFDFSKVLGAVDVEVCFEGLFYDFEKIKLRQEQQEIKLKAPKPLGNPVVGGYIIGKELIGEKEKDAVHREIKEKTPKEQEEQGAKTVSKKGLDFIAKHEGLVKKMDPDPVGFPTIGYGHKIEKWEVWDKNKELDPEEAWSLLEKDAEERAGKYVRNYVKPKLLQHQFDALTSFTFNVGGTRFMGSHLLVNINQEVYNKDEAGRETIRNDFLQYIHAGKGKKKEILSGLQARRNREANLFLNGVYDW
jgi:lysozyme